MKEQKIKSPMYGKEKMGRLVKWFFGLPLIFVLYFTVSLIMPTSASGSRQIMILNILSYLVFIMVTIVVVTKFLGFPFKKMVNQSGYFNYGFFLVGLITMFVLGAGTTFVWMAFRPDSFKFTMGPGFALDALLSLVLVVCAAFLEEVLCRSYIAYFRTDEMETRPRYKLVYCLASAAVFTIFHFQNPEVKGSQAVYSMIFYFIMGFAMMAITLKTKGIEAALGIHIANNLVNAWIFTYPNAALTTNALFTHYDNIGPMMLVQAVLCILASSFAVSVSSRKIVNE